MPPTYEPTGSFFGGSGNTTHVSYFKKCGKSSYFDGSPASGARLDPSHDGAVFGEAGRLVQNLHVKTGRPMRLYRADRVQAAEAHGDFTGCLVAAKVRSARFADLYKLKADALCLIADGIDIQILELDRQTLTRRTHEE